MKTTIKQLIGLALTSAALLLGGLAQAAPVLKMGVEGAYPPFNSIDASGKVVGFDVDIGNELCKRINRQCQWVTQQWDGMIPALQTGKFDVMVSSMTITPERSAQVLFTVPYYYSYAMMAAPTGSGLVFSREGLAGKTIGIQAGTSHEPWLPKKYGTGFNIKPYPSTDDMFLDFENGRLDGIFADVVIIEPWIAENGGAAVYEQVGETVTDPELGNEIGIAVRKEDTALVAELNKAITAMVEDGTFAKIAAKYFSFPLR